jgi:hypothetical protein
MTIDRSPEDELRETSEVPRGKLYEQGHQDAAHTSNGAAMAETRTRTEYYQAHRAGFDQHMRPSHDSSPAADAPSQQTAWNAIDSTIRPPLDRFTLPPDRARHILDGDENGGGGHRHGTGRPGKTEFPASWDDGRITDHIVDVARSPDRPPTYQKWNGRWLVRGTRDDVEIVVIVARDGRLWSGWPRPGGPGVVKNPEET